MAGSASSRDSASASFVRLAVLAPDAATAERAAAEAFEAGAAGLEEREEEGGITLLLYLPAGRESGLRAALEAGCGRDVQLGKSEAVVETDWSEAWKQGLEPVRISPRLVVRPSFCEPLPGTLAEVVIDPGQAFGTGGHVSTLLALEWIDALAASIEGARVLDAGCGSGVLALAALRLGAASALAFDIDPLATQASVENARANGLAERLQVVTGPLDSIAAEPFELVLANMLSREFLPLAAGLATRTAATGRCVFSGLLESERDRVVAALGRAGLRCVDERGRADANGDRWLALLTTR